MKRIIIQTLCSLGFVFFLMQPCWSATIVVVNTNDSGTGSLRAAIEFANNNPGFDQILFNISGVGPHEIFPLSQLPSLMGPTEISGYSQPGAVMATSTSSAIIQIAINGSDVVGQDIFGLTLGNNCTVSGLAIYHFPVGFNVGGNNNWVYGCHVGMNASGMVEMGNITDGILITGTGNLIGGPNVTNRNVIAGNGAGIAVFPYANSNTIQGNYIGTDATGNTTISNTYDGISIGSSNNMITDNVVVGHQNANIAIGWWMDDSPYPNANLVTNNRVGHHADGSFSSFEDNCQGITMVYAANTTVTENIVFGNGCHGVSVVGDISTGNLISNNYISGNGDIAINLGLDWVTSNDPGDIDTGPNNLQNFPVLQEAKIKGTKTKIKGTIDTQNPENVLIELYSVSVPHSSGYGGGETLIGTSYPNPNGHFKVDLPLLAVGTYVTAIAIDELNNTSEFSAALEVTNSNNLGSLTYHSWDVKAHPNPFVLETSISFRINESQWVKLDIFDAQGRFVQAMMHEWFPKGNHEFLLDLSQWPAGIYYYQLVGPEFLHADKLIKQK